MAAHLSFQLPFWRRTGCYYLLKSTFDAGEGKGDDHAYHLERLTRSVIEPRREIDEKDLQSQYDWIMTAESVRLDHDRQSRNRAH